jgi:hypothetical protein
MDRVLLWEVSQCRRRELMQLARAVKPRGRAKSTRSLARLASSGFRVGFKGLKGVLGAALRNSAAPGPRPAARP